jgi:hypothetical protein
VLSSRFANLRTAATYSFGDGLWRFLNYRKETTMKDQSKVTTPQPFGKFDEAALFSVNADIPVEHALEVAADLMMYVERLSAADAFIDKSIESGIIQHLSEMAKALTKACNGKVGEASGNIA